MKKKYISQNILSYLYRKINKNIVSKLKRKVTKSEENKTISVVYIITKLELGGAQKVCLELFNGLQKSGIDTNLVSGCQGTLVSTIGKNDQIFFIDSLKREVTLFGFLNEFKAFIELVRHLKKLKKNNPHLITHTHSTKAGFMGTWAALCAGVSTRVHTVHGYGFHDYQSKIGWLATYLVEFFTSFFITHYICVSSADIKTGVRLLPTFKKKYSLIRAAVNQAPFLISTEKKLSLVSEKIVSGAACAHKELLLPDAIASEPFIFGTIACFKPQKNIFDLLEAFNQVYTQHTSNIRLEIIGDGILRPKIEHWIAAHNLSDVIILHGWQHQVSPIMNRWHAFTLSSLWEGLPCSIVEARLLKLPVISYNTGGISDVILHTKNGLLVEQKNWQALGLAMLSIMQDKEFYKELCNYSDALDVFSATYMVNQHIQLYKRLVS